MNYVGFVQQKSSQLFDLLTEIEHQFIGRDALIKEGKFKGRRGRCTSILNDRSTLLFLVQPYRLSGEGDVLLWDDPAARTFLPITYFDFM